MALRLVIVGGLVALLVGVGVAGAQSERRQRSSNLVPAARFVAVVPAGQAACQRLERIPAGTGALRVLVGTYGSPGPDLAVRISGGSAPPLAGRRARGWREGDVLLPIATTGRVREGARVCLRNLGDRRVALGGDDADPSADLRVGAKALPARVRIEYVGPRRSSWWGLTGTLADRVATLRSATPGSATMPIWVVLLVAVAVGTVAILLLGRAAGRWVALLALVNALAWGLIVPPFQVPDETAHFYYATYLAETGKAPQRTPDNDWYSPAENALLGDFEFYRVIGVEDNRSPWDAAAARALTRTQDAGLDRVGRGDAATATTNSPVYYLPQAALSKLSPSGDALDRLALMRVLSAVLAGLTVLCVFGFLRELLPGTPWAWTVGSLVAALQPMFGFLSGGVNNDGLLYLCSAAVLYAIARGFRRGLTPGTGALLGGAFVVGVLAKTQLLAFLPAVVLALVLMVRRDRAARRGLGAAALWCAAPLALYAVLAVAVWDRPLIARVGEVASTPAGAAQPQLREQLSYLWQLYLPRLPIQDDLLPGLPLKNLWFDGLIGRFGWLDYGFPGWVYSVALAVCLLVAAGAVAALVAERATVRRRIGELVVYLAAAAGLAVAIAYAGYHNRIASGTPFEQARYLLPLLPLMAAVVALAVRWTGPRWGRPAGAALVVAAMGLSVFAQLLTVTRYYG